MVESKKIIVLGRHGKNKNNILTPEVIKKAYGFGKYLKEKYYKNENVDISNLVALHSGQPRTIKTSESILSGILGGEIPTNRRLMRGKIPIKPLIRRHALLGYEDIKYNEKELDEDEKEYMKIWTTNPNSTDFKGEHITSYNEMLRRGKACLVDTLDEMIQDSRNLYILMTHLSIVEPIFMAGINSARKNPATLNSIGGPFELGECAVLIFKEDKQKEYTKGKFIRKSKNYDVDLTNLLQICEE